MTYKKKLNDAHCYSRIQTRDRYIRDGCARLRLRVRTWIDFVPAGVRTYEGSDKVWVSETWSSAEQSSFRSKMKNMIRDGWGNGKLWILHDKKGTRDLWCDVTISYTSRRERAHLVVHAVNRPVIISGHRPGYRPTCEIGGVAKKSGDTVNPIDMHCTDSTVRVESRTAATSDQGNVTFRQNTMWHEFGHYLGLAHRCNGIGQGYCGARTAAEQEDIMAIGNTVRTRHAGPFLNRVKAHHYVPGAALKAYVAPNRHRRPWPH